MRGPRPPSGRSLERTRRARRLSALRALGVAGDAVRGFAQQVEAATKQTGYQHLPEQPRSGPPAQDPVTGAFTFLPDWSDPAGPDIRY